MDGRYMRSKLKKLPTEEKAIKIRELVFEEKVRTVRAEILQKFRELSAGGALSNTVTDQ